ncbi:MAG: DUF4469 domain-containing protein [Treponema sp.]|uniref:DUF4469 domain-containing protein n=1 Tax=Treponema sp. TaxID=166 RepID=UPI0025D423E8|nr:DUF4469 domain-containing protein [Treponema sp.]MBQ9622843.1 DUF4469 domain-containing protein [Treponema sp.]MBR0100660.1 DUF4469 domain-containing protein [Treponema sp.]MBR0495558.1 DUF4469 domain-containing protein [Treponema sp.]
MNINTLSQQTADYESSKLAVALYPTAMRKETDGKMTYHARTLFRNKLTMENIANDILATGSLTGYSVEQILSVWSVVNNAMIDRVLNGSIVDGGIGSYYARISGSFDSEQSSFDHKKNAIDIAFRSGKEVKELAKSISPVIAQGNSTKPEIVSVTDIESGRENVLTPGGFLDIAGKSILVTGSNEDVGLYFINVDDESKTVKLPASKIGVNTSSRIACVVPNLESGSWRIRIVTQYAKSTVPCRESKSQIFCNTFTVA